MTEHIRGSLRVRFWWRVGYETSQGCWPWDGPTLPGGYGKMWRSDFERLWHPSQLAHRIAYELEVGPIPDGLTLDHLCGNPNCVNPDHLEPVTQRVNTLRGSGPIAAHAVKTHCAHGHPYDEENTYHMPSGGRDCKICVRRRGREYRLRRKERSQ